MFKIVGLIDKAEATELKQIKNISIVGYRFKNL